ncbi:hypothetical protein C8J57DRAFT_309698 [Mycena rebaudengoi]|nr:hypothetical protein C8J57DRAFT_309698 [Mycena rebaudengoi]
MWRRYTRRANSAVTTSTGRSALDIASPYRRAREINAYTASAFKLHSARPNIQGLDAGPNTDKARQANITLASATTMLASFKVSDLPNPILLTDPANIAFLKKKQEEDAALEGKTAQKVLGMTTKTNVRSFALSTNSRSYNTTQVKKRKADASANSTSTKKPKKAATDDAPNELFSITLPGDEDATVEVFDTCDELRRKINALLRTGTITKAALLRDMSRAAYADAPNIQSKQLSDFLTKMGPTSGSTSRVCYASYVYFEKKRIAEGKAKSKHRQDMEDRWGGQGGLPQRREERYLCRADDAIVQDALGSVRVIPGGCF